LLSGANSVHGRAHPTLRAAAFFFMIVANSETRETAMCYISWIASMGPALGVGAVNAIGLQANSKFARESQRVAIEAQGQFS
jgi:hypothetical protein